MAFLICTPLLLISAAWLSSPTKPSKSQIIGHYEIDRTKHPGKQADWQHATYSLEITEAMVIVRDSRTDTTWESPIEWSGTSRYRWFFSSREKRHHIIAEGPAIHRKPFGFYYVFKSPLYGDVFFVKK